MAKLAQSGLALKLYQGLMSQSLNPLHAVFDMAAVPANSDTLNAIFHCSSKSKNE